MKRKKVQVDLSRFPGVCRRIPSSARERVIFSPGKDGEAGDVGFIVDAAGCSQAKKGLLEARSNSTTGSQVERTQATAQVE